MPGPGGGSRGGGGHRGGGFSGGGFRGGNSSFGGNRTYRPPIRTGSSAGSGNQGCGSGCLGGALSVLLLPFMLTVMMFAMVGSCSNNRYPDYDYGYESIGGYYDEEALQDYADGQYRAAFGDLQTYEDNLLLVLLTEEDNCSFTWIAWVGDHIATDINWLFGNEETALGSALAQCINEQNYKYSLDSNLADAMKMMTKEIQYLNRESSFECTEERAPFDSHLVNHTELPMTEETVNDALTYFTQQTGIPSVIVVEDAQAVFGEKNTEQPDVQEPEEREISWIPVVAVVLLAAVVIVLVRNRKKEKQDPVDAEEARRRKQYSEFDDQYK